MYRYISQKNLLIHTRCAADISNIVSSEKHVAAAAVVAVVVVVITRRCHGDGGNIVQDLPSHARLVTQQVQDGVHRGAELHLKPVHTSVGGCGHDNITMSHIIV